MILWVLEENLRARKFYEKAGFEYEGSKEVINLGKEFFQLKYILNRLG